MGEEPNVPPGDSGEPSVFTNEAGLTLPDAVAMAFLWAYQRFIQGFVLLSFALLVLLIAAFLYGSFYFSYMPRAAFSAPVHYYYRTDCESPTSFLCSYPLANISLIRNKKHVLTLRQPYRISLHLEMPESPANRKLGMFMIRMTCFSQDGGQVATSAHSSFLRYRSDLLRTLGTLLFLPAYLIGAAEQKQELEVELFSDFTDDPYAPSDTAIIEILSNKVQIYSSQLYIHAHFTGLRYLMFNFPLFSALVGICSNVIFLSMLLILGYTRRLLRFNREPEQIRAHVLQSEKGERQRQEKDKAKGLTEVTSTNLHRRKQNLHKK